ncbi:MAG TPA: Rieske 2Fe-2S domain-containing protein, partial [Acidimicrobiales bacterium]|nr:Rieske 2Fe-2S domain-containing protein [Acidimicrobiales bacterium]
MRVTLTGHAGLFVESGETSVLCDPWFTPAFFASWFPFPDNADLDVAAISRPTYLYISHLHRDHYDEEFLARWVAKDTTVLLPDYPLPELRRCLEGLGFTNFIQTREGEPIDLEGFRASIWTSTTPADGPLGDSSLVLDDGRCRLLNQNDARPRDLDALLAQGPFDAHFLQFSGAVWFPMVYRFPEEEKRALGEDKRANQLARALRYVAAVDARHVFPCAGPPAFLDDALFHLNDLDGDRANIFPDQTVFLSYLAEHGIDRGHLLLPGSVATLDQGSCAVRHPLPEEEIADIFTNKRSYLKAYQERRRPQFEAALAACPEGTVDVVAALKEWFEPLLARADATCEGVGGVAVIDVGSDAVAVDFPRREVRRWQGEDWEFRFHLEARLVESLIERRVDDWVNEVFLSCRFEAERRGSYNEMLYSFFKCLTPERIAYLESVYRPDSPTAGQVRGRRAAWKAPEGEEGEEMWVCQGYLVQRRCPHLGGDLVRFGEVEDGVLTCTVHGWKFELATGRCLTSDTLCLDSRPLGGPGEEGTAGA